MSPDIFLINSESLINPPFVEKDDWKMTTHDRTVLLHIQNAADRNPLKDYVIVPEEICETLGMKNMDVTVSLCYLHRKGIIELHQRGSSYFVYDVTVTRDEMDVQLFGC